VTQCKRWTRRQQIHRFRRHLLIMRRSSRPCASLVSARHLLWVSGAPTVDIHTRAHTYTVDTPKLTRARMHIDTFMHVYTHTHTLLLSLSLTHTHTHIHTHTHTQTRIHKLTRIGGMLASWLRMKYPTSIVGAAVGNSRLPFMHTSQRQYFVELLLFVQ
jgi:hypothetical protein